jgi:16S rRNA (cytosine967-C5)-methyltransferase
MAKVSPARMAAFEILRLVGDGKGHSDELLHGAQTAGLSAEDRNLATALVMGVLRWQIALDARLGGLLTRPGQRLAEPVAIALRMGAFQLLHMDRIPDHAALSESVELCKAAGEEHATGMVNAVLRKVAEPRSERRDPSTGSGQALGRPSELGAEFAERLGHPAWLVERWVNAYGRDAALAICEYGQREPARGGIFAAEAEPASQLGADASVMMDDGSRLVAEIAAGAMPAVEGRAASVWDCCAAPGGKTLVLAKRLAGAAILASDVSARRLAQTAARLRRYAFAPKVKTAVLDAATAGSGDERFDLILCDVPCSGTGTLARNPEIRHLLKPEDFVRQSARQRAILRGALGRLAPGGRLVYATCSLEPEENERVAEAVAAESGVRKVPIEPMLTTLVETSRLRAEAGVSLRETAVRDGALRTLPGVHPCDGFFAVVLERA